MTVDDILKERGARYGVFYDHAHICQSLKEIMQEQPGWVRLAADQKQSLEVMADKIARILNGDPDYLDNWDDIQGYGKLVSDRLRADAAVVSQPSDGELKALPRIYESPSTQSSE